ncbi:hypothetical protein IW262DRAFT_1484982 [Armillaria fumosa]|nr:hypothetical protein IW262DRAFT_1484982 [Armillaria fumosa]
MVPGKQMSRSATNLLMKAELRKVYVSTEPVQEIRWETKGGDQKTGIQYFKPISVFEMKRHGTGTPIIRRHGRQRKTCIVRPFVSVPMNARPVFGNVTVPRPQHILYIRKEPPQSSTTALAMDTQTTTVSLDSGPWSGYDLSNSPLQHSSLNLDGFDENIDDDESSSPSVVVSSTTIPSDSPARGRSSSHARRIRTKGIRGDSVASEAELLQTHRDGPDLPDGRRARETESHRHSVAHTAHHSASRTRYLTRRSAPTSQATSPSTPVAPLPPTSPSAFPGADDATSQFTSATIQGPPPRAGTDIKSTLWDFYNHEARAADEDILKHWHDDMSTLLIVAGLFSAVLTAFIIEFYRKLEPDYTAISAHQQHTMSINIQAMLNASLNLPVEPIYDAADPITGFQPSPAIVWTVGLWFSALAYSISVVVLAWLVKLWFLAYMKGMNNGNAHDYQQLHCLYHFGNNHLDGVGIFYHNSITIIL